MIKFGINSAIKTINKLKIIIVKETSEKERASIVRKHKNLQQ